MGLGGPGCHCFACSPRRHTAGGLFPPEPGATEEPQGHQGLVLYGHHGHSRGRSRVSGSCQLQCQVCRWFGVKLGQNSRNIKCTIFAILKCLRRWH